MGFWNLLSGNNKDDTKRAYVIDWLSALEPPDSDDFLSSDTDSDQPEPVQVVRRPYLPPPTMRHYDLSQVAYSQWQDPYQSAIRTQSPYSPFYQPYQPPQERNAFQYMRVLSPGIAQFQQQESDDGDQEDDDDDEDHEEDSGGTDGVESSLTGPSSGEQAPPPVVDVPPPAPLPPPPPDAAAVDSGQAATIELAPPPPPPPPAPLPPDDVVVGEPPLQCDSGLPPPPAAPPAASEDVSAAVESESFPVNAVDEVDEVKEAPLPPPDAPDAPNSVELQDDSNGAKEDLPPAPPAPAPPASLETESKETQSSSSMDSAAGDESAEAAPVSSETIAPEAKSADEALPSPPPSAAVEQELPVVEAPASPSNANRPELQDASAVDVPLLPTPPPPLPDQIPQPPGAFVDVVDSVETVKTIHPPPPSDAPDIIAIPVAPDAVDECAEHSPPFVEGVENRDDAGAPAPPASPTQKSVAFDPSVQDPKGGKLTKKDKRSYKAKEAKKKAEQEAKKAKVEAQKEKEREKVKKQREKEKKREEQTGEKRTLTKDAKGQMVLVVQKVKEKGDEKSLDRTKSVKDLRAMDSVKDLKKAGKKDSSKDKAKNDRKGKRGKGSKSSIHSNEDVNDAGDETVLDAASLATEEVEVVDKSALSAEASSTDETSPDVDKEKDVSHEEIPQPQPALDEHGEGGDASEHSNPPLASPEHLASEELEEPVSSPTSESDMTQEPPCVLDHVEESSQPSEELSDPSVLASEAPVDDGESAASPTEPQAEPEDCSVDRDVSPAEAAAPEPSTDVETAEEVNTHSEKAPVSPEDEVKAGSTPASSPADDHSIAPLDEQAALITADTESLPPTPSAVADTTEHDSKKEATNRSSDTIAAVGTDSGDLPTEEVSEIPGNPVDISTPLGEPEISAAAADQPQEGPVKVAEPGASNSPGPALAPENEGLSICSEAPVQAPPEVKDAANLENTIEGDATGEPNMPSARTDDDPQQTDSHNDDKSNVDAPPDEKICDGGEHADPPDEISAHDNVCLSGSADEEAKVEGKTEILTEETCDPQSLDEHRPATGSAEQAVEDAGISESPSPLAEESALNEPAISTEPVHDAATKNPAESTVSGEHETEIPNEPPMPSDPHQLPAALSEAQAESCSEPSEGPRVENNTVAEDVPEVTDTVHEAETQNEESVASEHPEQPVTIEESDTTSEQVDLPPEEEESIKVDAEDKSESEDAEPSVPGDVAEQGPTGEEQDTNTANGGHAAQSPSTEDVSEQTTSMKDSTLGPAEATRNYESSEAANAEDSHSGAEISGDQEAGTDDSPAEEPTKGAESPAQSHSATPPEEENTGTLEAQPEPLVAPKAQDTPAEDSSIADNVENSPKVAPDQLSDGHWESVDIPITLSDDEPEDEASNRLDDEFIEEDKAQASTEPPAEVEPPQYEAKADETEQSAEESQTIGADQAAEDSSPPAADQAGGNASKEDDSAPLTETEPPKEVENEASASATGEPSGDGEASGAGEPAPGGENQETTEPAALEEADAHEDTSPPSPPPPPADAAATDETEGDKEGAHETAPAEPEDAKEDEDEPEVDKDEAHDPAPAEHDPAPVEPEDAKEGEDEPEVDEEEAHDPAPVEPEDAKEGKDDHSQHQDGRPIEAEEPPTEEEKDVNNEKPEEEPVEELDEAGEEGESTDALEVDKVNDTERPVEVLDVKPGENGNEGTEREVGKEDADAATPEPLPTPTTAKGERRHRRHSHSHRMERPSMREAPKEKRPTGVADGIFSLFGAGSMLGSANKDKARESGRTRSGSGTSKPKASSLENDESRRKRHEARRVDRKKREEGDLRRGSGSSDPRLAERRQEKASASDYAANYKQESRARPMEDDDQGIRRHREQREREERARTADEKVEHERRHRRKEISERDDTRRPAAEGNGTDFKARASRGSTKSRSEENVNSPPASPRALKDAGRRHTDRGDRVKDTTPAKPSLLRALTQAEPTSPRTLLLGSLFGKSSDLSPTKRKMTLKDAVEKEREHRRHHERTPSEEEAHQARRKERIERRRDQALQALVGNVKDKKNADAAQSPPAPPAADVATAPEETPQPAPPPDETRIEPQEHPHSKKGESHRTSRTAEDHERPRSTRTESHRPRTSHRESGRERDHERHRDRDKDRERDRERDRDRDQGRERHHRSSKGKERAPRSPPASPGSGLLSGLRRALVN